ncbi:50S ribosomal protein L9 [Paenibacillus sp. TRM 82003]|uniref:50S ribosomal protein L9 n=1 Tax=Kineococcus sp. TRM81007 TaxID=2925831 RepID=UPI001F58CEA9|nr:50S ribosomal protein L9 [Kineococcus sp. TRM81007]MCI2236954.1 50S ribosomal protein L9 [Kineococcus sp. TRM81007]MCI3926389.1 50S ribosomal protein L9 [Paenibacillus sp. TRM 82003]
MKLILTHEVSGLGTPGDVVEVKDGYGRNYLLPRNLATPWTKGGEKQVESIRKARKTREIASIDDAKAVKQSIESRTVAYAARAGQGGRLFGAVTPADVALAVTAAGGPAIDKRKVELPQPIRTVGVHKAFVRLHPEVSATVTIDVVAAQG